MSEASSKTSEDLTRIVAAGKAILAKFPEAWQDAPKHEGECDEGWGDHKSKAQPVVTFPAFGNRDEFSYCSEHSYSYKERRKEILNEAAEAEDELKFRTLMDKITRFSQLKDLVSPIRQLISRQRNLAYDRREQPLMSSDKEKVLNLLRLLDKIQPTSSQFLDRGVAVNSDLYLAGTIRERGSYRYEYDSSVPMVVLTALDQDERYKSIARVRMTIGEAERLRSLLTECIEHVRISKMIYEIETVLKVKLPEEKEVEK